MAELVISNASGDALLRVDLAGRTKLTIGKSQKCDVRLTGKGISRHHALLVGEAGSWLAINLSAQNGMFLREKPVRTAVVCDHSPIRIGDAYLWFFGIATQDVRAIPVLRGNAPRACTRAEYLELLWQEGTISETDYRSAVA